MKYTYNYKTLSLRVDESFYNKVSDASHAARMSKTDFVKAALIDYMSKRDEMFNK